MVQIKPLNDYVLVEPVKEEDKTSSWIITTPSAKEKPWKGKVLNIGEWKTTNDGKLIKIENIKQWDIVYFTKYSPEEIDIDWNKYLLVRLESIIAKQE